jgi:hypothetical protein
MQTYQIESCLCEIKTGYPCQHGMLALNCIGWKTLRWPICTPSCILKQAVCLVVARYLVKQQPYLMSHEHC